MTRYRDLAEDDLVRARSLLAAMEFDDQVHHFQRAMSDEDFDRWQARAADHLLIGAFGGGELVGLIELAFGAEGAECSLYVAPEHRRQGIGTALFERACRAAREIGARTLTVLVTRGDAEMLDMAVRHDGLSVYRHGRSLILPEGDHSKARWLVFTLDDGAPESWFAETITRVRERLGL